MDDDWQEAVFSSRHVHNRKKKRGSGISGSDAAFDVRKSFGTYELKGRIAGMGQLHIYRLTDDGLGLVGQIHLPGTLHAPCILAGSRETLGILDARLGGSHHHDNTPTQESQVAAAVDDGQAQANNQLFETAGDEAATAERSETDTVGSSSDRESRRPSFAKNTFRSPKWWLRWRGVFSPSGLGSSSSTDNGSSLSSGMGYIVFSGNKCTRFRGTLSSDDDAWDNVAVTAWKVKTNNASDIPIEWPPAAAAASGSSSQELV